MLEASEGYGRWEWTWRGCCPCTRDCGRFGSTTNFSVSFTKLSVILVCNTHSVHNTHSWKHRRVKPSKYRYIHQGITLIGPHCKTFTNGLGTIIKVQVLFSQCFKEGQLDRQRYKPLEIPKKVSSQLGSLRVTSHVWSIGWGSLDRFDIQCVFKWCLLWESCQVRWAWGS